MDSAKSPAAKFYSDISVLLREHKDVKVATGNSYDTLLRTLSNSDSETELVTEILKDLEQCVSMLNGDYQPLVTIIMKMKWLDRDPELISAYQSFMLNLVSAHMFYLKPCLRMLISLFMPGDTNVELTENSSEAKKKEAQRKRDSFSHIHFLLKSLNQMVPLTSVVLIQMLESLFPYINKSVSYFEDYTQNVLFITKYMPAQRLEILELVVKNMLKLDVRSSRIEITMAMCFSEEDCDTEETIFDMDDTVEMKPENSKEPPKGDRLTSAVPQAGSLDAMMTIMFDYIKDQCFINDKLDWEATKKLYRELLYVFNKFILPTHASCHVQFLMFYICSFREALADGFIDFLWKKVTDPAAQSVYRQSAACYIGSFLTRASYISVKTAKEMIELMVKWIHSYMDQICDQGLNPDLNHHAPFYLVCQSVFYIFCFKHNDFSQIKRGHRWAESLNFQRIVTSKLNPLRFCVPIIVNTFASAARLHQLAFCDTIIERNNRYSLPVTASTFGVGSVKQKHLEAYFPFDPYLLPRSCWFIRPLYREYRGHLLQEDDIDYEDMQDEDDFLPADDEEEINQSAAYQISLSLMKSNMDILQYGTSPGFKNV